MRVFSLPASSSPVGRVLRVIALAVAAALALSACSGDDGAATDDSTATVQKSVEPADGGTTQPGTTEPESDTGTATDDVTSQSAAQAGVDPTQLGDPIATAERPAQDDDDPEAMLRYDVYGLWRSGETVTLIAGVTPQTSSDQQQNLFGWTGSSSHDIVLIDTVNLRRHDILGQDATRAVTGAASGSFGNGQTMYLYAVFAAPPQDVTTMNILMGGLPAITDVPLQ